MNIVLADTIDPDTNLDVSKLVSKTVGQKPLIRCISGPFLGKFHYLEDVRHLVYCDC